MFDVTIYTDTLANEALDGAVGFNFQAASPGMTAGDRGVVKENLRHQVVKGWSAQHDPLAHPESFGYYQRDGRYYLARGKSTGQTNSGRPGNSITEAIASSDMKDFGGMRPAQLFGAVNWRLEKAPGKTIAPWPTPLEVKPEFETEAICQMVLDDQWSRDHLPDFLTMVEQAAGGEQRKRLVIITSDAELAQRWIALGTLFLDAETAFALTITGLVQDPMRLTQNPATFSGDLVAASPAFGPQPDPTVARSGANVIDLDRQLVGPIDKSNTAIQHANWFLTGDPAAALAAIELSRRWAPFMGPEKGAEAAAVATFEARPGNRETWRTSLDALNALVKHEQHGDLFFYGDVLATHATSVKITNAAQSRLTARVVLGLVGAAAGDAAEVLIIESLKSLGESAFDVSSSGMEALVAWLDTVSRAAPGLRLTWNDSSARVTASDLLSKIAERLNESDLPALFSAAMTLDIPLNDLVRRGAVIRLARLWSRHPELTHQCDDVNRPAARWAYSDLVARALATELSRVWSAGDQVALRLLKGRNVDELGPWDWLANSPALTDAEKRQIDPWLFAARLSRIPSKDRARYLRESPRLPDVSWLVVLAEANPLEDADLIRGWLENQGEVSVPVGRWILQQFEHFAETGKPAPGTQSRELLVSLTQMGVADPALLNRFDATSAQPNLGRFSRPWGASRRSARRDD